MTTDTNDRASASTTRYTEARGALVRKIAHNRGGVYDASFSPFLEAFEAAVRAEERAAQSDPDDVICRRCGWVMAAGLRS